MMSKSARPYDVIVVGAGISGLVAAHHLTKAGWKVLVLEARNRLGGRIDTVNIGVGKIDLGASYIHGIHGNPIYPVAKKLNIDLYFMEMTRGALRDHNGCQLDPDLESQLLENAFDVLFTHLRNVSQVSPTSGAPSSSIPISDPFFASDSPLFTNLKDEGTKKQAECLGRTWSGWCGADLEDVSYRWWGFERDTIGPDALITSGYVTIIEWLKQGIEQSGGVIKLGHEVTGIKVSEEDKQVIITTSWTEDANGLTPSQSYFSAPYTLVTLPLGVLKRQGATLFSPPLPPRRLASIGSLGFGLLNKVLISYGSAWWSEKEDNDGFFLLPDPADPTCLLGRASAPAAVFVHNMWKIQAIPAFCIFLGGSGGEHVEQLSDEEVRAWAERSIARYLSPSSPPPSSTDVRVTRWRSDPYSFGSYCFIPPSKPTPNYQEAEASPLDMIELSHPLWGRVFFAGEHTDPDEFASVHGAWNSGLREARKLDIVLEAVGDEDEEAGGPS